ncbi:hypothetical protein HMPREF0496_2880 [Lentilactobacillus hilgardii ATCC 27305]|nr:hypothetical protein HMPREF0496_2880 [Lentilactobacillus hilgardii ATCC 27305]
MYKRLFLKFISKFYQHFKFTMKCRKNKVAEACSLNNYTKLIFHYSKKRDGTKVLNLVHLFFYTK